MSRKNRCSAKRAKRHGRRGGKSRRVSHQESLVALWNWLLPDEGIFAKVKLHGNTTWLPRSLVWLALCWAWSESHNLTDAFIEAAGWCRRILAFTPLTTYQGFMGALARWTPTFID